jgi:hypothetical protein
MSKRHKLVHASCLTVRTHTSSPSHPTIPIRQIRASLGSHSRVYGVAQRPAIPRQPSDRDVESEPPRAEIADTGPRAHSAALDGMDEVEEHGEFARERLERLEAVSACLSRERDISFSSPTWEKKIRTRPESKE